MHSVDELIELSRYLRNMGGRPVAPVTTPDVTYHHAFEDFTRDVMAGVHALTPRPFNAVEEDMRKLFDAFDFNEAHETPAQRLQRARYLTLRHYMWQAHACAVDLEENYTLEPENAINHRHAARLDMHAERIFQSVAPSLERWQPEHSIRDNGAFYRAAGVYLETGLACLGHYMPLWQGLGVPASATSLYHAQDRLVHLQNHFIAHNAARKTAQVGAAAAPSASRPRPGGLRLVVDNTGKPGF